MTLQEQIDSLGSEQSEWINIARYYLSFRTPEQRERQERELQRLRNNAAKISKEADKIETALTEWQERYVEATNKIENLGNEIKVLQVEIMIEEISQCK